MSRDVTVRIVNGFATPGGGGQPAQGGNPAGVVLDADGLTEADMLRIASRVGHSETAFVSASATEGFRLDFFTPTRRIAHCGHATIAAFGYMADLGRVGEGETSKETVDGPRRIVIEQGAAYMEQLAPRYEDSADWADRGVTEGAVLAFLGLGEGDLREDLRPVLVNTGNSFVVVGVRSSDVLSRIVPDLAAIARVSERLDLVGYYVFATDVDQADATARMFAPRYGIDEEAATGMAAGPLACVLHDCLGRKAERLRIVQGDFMDPPSPSQINVRLSIVDGGITGLMAGGLAQVMREVRVSLD